MSIDESSFKTFQEPHRAWQFIGPRKRRRRNRQALRPRDLFLQPSWRRKATRAVVGVRSHFYLEEEPEMRPAQALDMEEEQEEARIL